MHSRHAPRTRLGLRLHLDRFRAVVALIVLLWSCGRAAEPTWPEPIVRALDQAGTNRAEIERALAEVPSSEREGLEFLVAHMPERDLRSLGASFLLENVRLAYAAFKEAPWRDRLPQALFLNDVLPYACATERRDAWRPVLREKAAALIQDCRSPGEAAIRLNERLFPELKVKYSTQRRRADQSPLETMESGMASCTGLSILLIDACRAVGVPARLVGTPNWADGRGNHTWVEVWDGDWHFLGAAEPDPNGLDRGWFAGDAAKALKDSRDHAIYATSYRRTGLSFPLVWARRAEYVNAVNVTDRYTARAKPAAPDETRLMIKVVDGPNGPRVSARVRLLTAGDHQPIAEGISRDERADLNDLLSFQVKKGEAYRVEAELEGRRGSKRFSGTTNDQAILTVTLPAQPNPPGGPTSSGCMPTRGKGQEIVAQCRDNSLQIPRGQMPELDGFMGARLAVLPGGQRDPWGWTTP